MSTVTVAQLAVYGVLYMAVGGVYGIGKVSSWLRGEDQKKNAVLDELEKTREIVRKKLSDDITAELGRLYGSGREALRDELESLRASDDMDAAAERLNALRQRVREAGIDEAQRSARADGARRLLDGLRALGVQAWETELARLEGELEKILTLPAEESLLELQGLTDRLQEMETLSGAAAGMGELPEERRYVPPDGDAETEARLRVIREIRDWAGRIAMMDGDEGEKLRPVLENLRADTPFPDRLTRVRSQMKTAWGALRERAASTEFFREKLRDLLELLRASKTAAESAGGSELIRRCDTLLGGKYVDRGFFMALYEDALRFVWARGEEVADAFFAQKVGQALSELGYGLLTDEAPPAGQVCCLESPREGYRVMLKVDAGSVTARLVRVAENEVPAADQRQKDIEAGNKWCGDFDKFLETMRERNLPLDVTVRREPEETELMTVAGSPKKRRSRKDRRGQSQDARMIDHT